MVHGHWAVERNGMDRRGHVPGPLDIYRDIDLESNRGRTWKKKPDWIWERGLNLEKCWLATQAEVAQAGGAHSAMSLIGQNAWDEKAGLVLRD